jgi:hypothetical protein
MNPPLEKGGESGTIVDPAGAGARGSIVPS